MILSYPLVNERGETTGCEITFRLQDIESVNQMRNYNFREGRENPGPEVIDGCCVIIMNYNSHDIKANYNELKELFKEWNRVYR